MMKHFIAALIVVGCVGSAGAQETLVKAAKVYTLTGKPIAPGMVRIKDGKIAEVATDIKPPFGAKIVDLGSGVLIPGLVDAFNNLGVDGGSSEQTKEITPSLRILDCVDWSARPFRISLSEGTTTVGLVPGTDNVIAGLTGIAKTAGEAKSRVIKNDHALLIAACSDPAAGNSARNRPDSIYARQPTNRMGVVWVLRSEFGRANESKLAGMEPVREALAGKRPVFSVSRLEQDIQTALRLQRDYPMSLTIAAGQEAYKARETLAAAKVPVLLAKQPVGAGVGPEQTEIALNNAGLLNEAGVVFALTGGQLLDQARFAVRHGLPADAALASITAVPAKLLGVEGRVGTIAVGRDADLVALSGDPLDFTTAVRWTMCDGVIHEDR